jgi:predicted nucleotidyltransferase
MSASELESAVVEVAAVLEQLAVPYMLVGGLAVASWGEPRSTLDVDLTVWAESGMDSVVAALERSFKPAIPDAPRFVAKTRVLPLSTSRGIRVDVIFAALPFEKEMIGRASRKQFGDRSVPVASVEDLILMKSVSERTKDQEDVRRLTARFRNTLDKNYLNGRLGEFSEALDRADLLKLMI